jgi:hypothetical protein
MSERPIAVVVIILAASLGVSVVIFTAAAAWTLVDERLALSDVQTSLVASIIGGLLGALATYLGIGHSTPQASPPIQKTEAAAPDEPPPSLPPNV